VYRGKSFRASGRISCPDDEETVAQNLRYENSALMQRFVTCSRTRGSGFEGISLAATEKEKKKVLEFFFIQNYYTYKHML